MDSVTPLSALRKGQTGTVTAVSEAHLPPGSPNWAGVLERRLLEMGFVEGSHVTLTHDNLGGGNLVVVRVRAHHTLALRKDEARAILIRQDAPPPLYSYDPTSL